LTAAEQTSLTELEQDALTELVNIAVSRAAKNLREMVGGQVLLSVPTVNLVSRQQAIAILGEREVNKLVAVHQVFEGDITGRALLIFPETKSLSLVRAIVGQDMVIEDIIDLEQEALAETGNIILNSCLSTIANMLERSLRVSLPEVIRGSGVEFFNLAPPPQPGQVVLFLYINFTVKEHDVTGYIALLMDMPSLVTLKQLLNQLIERIGGTEP
jgi:chemotaxis protein CheC